MKNLRDSIQSLFTRGKAAFQRLNLGWKIYVSLAAILIPVFMLTIFVQTQVSSPLLEEEVRQIGMSACRSLASDINAFHLLSKVDQLEAKLIEVTWQQPSVVRLDVIVHDTASKDPSARKILASNLVEEALSGVEAIEFGDTPRTELRHEQTRDYWDIVYPIRDHKKVMGHIHAEVSLQLVQQVVGIFTKIALTGNLLAIALLIGLLSYYLRHLIENERKLQRAETKNIELTEQMQEMQRQLFLSEKLAIMGQMTAAFAHEIGTPLNSLSGHAQLLREEAADPSARSRIDIINSQISRIEGIVKDFLASTHTPAQQRQLVDIRDVVQRISKLIAPRTAALKAEVVIDVHGDVAPIRVVPTDIEQVLLNLANNAIDSMEKSSGERTLRFEARQRPTPQAGQRTELQIIVRDTGEGMSPEILKNVRKPFFTTKAPGQGTGLGLTISQRLIKKYGGKLELESQLGRGTAVTISIPYDAA